MLKARYTGCIYLATNQINGRAYVGKTIMKLCDRKTIHVHTAKRGGRSVFHLALRKYGTDAFLWSKLFESDCEQTLFAAERQLIVDYRQNGVRLYNVGAGGEGQSVPCSPERREKVRVFMRTHQDAGRNTQTERIQQGCPTLGRNAREATPSQAWHKTPSLD